MSFKTIRSILEYQEELDSQFTHDGDRYDLNKLLRLTADRQIRYFKTSDLDWILDYTEVHEHRIKIADLTAPILITISNDKMIVLDGAHRLARAVRDQVQELPGVLVTAEDLQKCKI